MSSENGSRRASVSISRFRSSMVGIPRPSVQSILLIRTRRKICTGRAMQLEHRVTVRGGLRHGLKNVPMLHDLTLSIQPEDVDPRPFAVARPLLATVEDDVVAFGDHPHEMHPLAGVLHRHSLEVRDESLLAVSH